MRSKIAARLGIYFIITLVVFSGAMSTLFFIFFRNHTVSIYKGELGSRAQNIAETLVTLLSGDKTGPGRGQSINAGYRAYIRLLNEIAMADVWIVDEDLDLIMLGQSHGRNDSYTFSDLPEIAGKIVDEAMTGSTACSESFSSLFDDPVITVGVPIELQGGDIAGVLLLHSPVKGMNEAIEKAAFILLASVLASFSISVILSLLLSRKFTKPLKVMDDNALRLADGDYSARNEIKQDDEIGALAAKLDILAERLNISSINREKLEELRKEFVANVSHDLKTPITVIRGSLEAIIDGIVKDPVKTKEYHEQMLKESKVLQKLVEELLDLARLQDRDYELDIEDIDIGELLTETIESAKRISQVKNLEILLEAGHDKYVIRGDRYKLRQMFMAVMDNAVKFSPGGGIINIRVQSNGGVEISISDEGPGISKEDLPYIFDRFYKTRSDNSQGTGLGLAIAKQTALRHSIGLTVNSELGKGTKFIFKFKDKETGYEDRN